MRPARALWRREPLLPRSVRMVLLFAFAIGALVSLGPGGAAPAQPDRGAADAADPDGSLVEEGRTLFLEGCSSCHGEDARGMPGRGPSLRGVGEMSADFYLRTGRMPLADPEDQPRRAESPYTERQIDALVAYVGSFGGPAIPEVHPEQGDLSEGYELFADSCMGCHQVVGQGGIVTRGLVPDLQVSEPVDVAEAVRIGPYLMPHFRGRFDDREIDSLARYVEYTQDPVDRGGWGLGHIGPIPEGMVTWLLAIAALLLAIRLIGERTT